MTGTAEPTRRIWITRFVDRVAERTGVGRLVAATLTLGAVPVALTAVFFSLTAGSLTPRFAVAHVLAATVPVIAPAAIWYWDSRVYERFVERTADIAVDPEAVREAGARYAAVFADRYPSFAVPWTGLIVALYLLNGDYFATIGVSGPADPAFWAYAAFAVWWGLLTGVGFHGAITAVRAIRAVGDCDLEIDPLNPDGLGGLSSVGHLAVWTTMLVSLGSLTLPMAFILGTRGGYRTLVYVAVGAYVGLIAFSFAYPTVYVNRRAQAIREAELEDRRARIRELQAQVDAGPTPGADDASVSTDAVATRLELRRLRDEFQEYAGVSLYPLSVGVVLRLASSLLLPLFFILFETFLGRVL